jgi:hypothetical protein
MEEGSLENNDIMMISRDHLVDSRLEDHDRKAQSVSAILYTGSGEISRKTAT